MLRDVKFMKRECIIICPLGLSPPIVTEFLDYTCEVLGYNVKRIFLIATKEEGIIKSVKFTEAAIKSKYPKIKVDVDYIDYADINTEDAVINYMKLILRKLRILRNKYDDIDIFVNIAGGRKTMVMLTALAATLIGIPHIYHVIASDIKVFNENLERIRCDISEISKLDNLDKRVKEYISRKDKLDPIMYPPKESYKVIQLPIVP